MRLQNRPIAMDARMLGDGHTGVGSYARALAAAQARIASAPLRIGDGGIVHGRWGRRLRALVPGPRRLGATADGLVHADLFRLAQVHFDLHGRLLTLRAPGPPGLVHWTYPLPLRIAGWANLYTVHDAIPLVRPDLTPIDARRHRRLLAQVAAAATRLVTVSAAAAAEIAGALALPAHAVVECGVAVAPVAPSPTLPAGLTRDGYLLFVGSVERRKNLARLAEAHAASGTALPLVVAGPDGWQAPALDRPGILRLPYLPAADVSALIAGARALLLPSLAEGFGLPVVEAMALGTPVVTSDRGALAEVAGGAALTVDPADTAALAAALGRIADDAALRAALVARGRANAARFTPARFAARLDALYGSIAPAG